MRDLRFSGDDYEDCFLLESYAVLLGNEIPSYTAQHARSKQPSSGKYYHLHSYHISVRFSSLVRDGVYNIRPFCITLILRVLPPQ